MNDNIKNFSDYIYQDMVTLENDGYIGIPIDFTVFYDKKYGKICAGPNGTPIILYVINTNIERIGTASDSEIVSSMIERGFVVILIDYKNSERAVSPALDYSLQGLRQRIINQNKGDALSIFEEGRYVENFVVPSGYDIELSNPFWAFDKHGADGILEKIVEIWNNDFKGTHPDKLVYWKDEKGNRKKTAAAFDGSLPVWCNKDSESCENGSYINIKYTVAESIEDCVKPDGTPIDLNLYMHIIYPKRPIVPVPVMCLSSSAEHLALGSATADRPHLNGFLLRGYAGVMFDYGYTPMARQDHYGYFDGYPKKGYVTGDNATYSLSFYNDKRIFTAAMRYIRYLALSNENFKFDINALGVYGNSKGAWMTFLGEKNPEKFTSKRVLANHHDETRYDAGHAETVGKIRGGEKQPWLEYQGIEIKSEAEMIYSSCGGIDDAITDNHCPMFISCNRTDSSCYSTSNAMLSACRNNDVPTMFVDIPLHHTLNYGKDLVYGFDAYLALYDFAGYYLKGDPLNVVGVKENFATIPYSIKIRFSGGVSSSEISKITIEDANGSNVNGEWHGAYGGVEWTFIPDELSYFTQYTLNIPSNTRGKNGKTISEAYSYSFVSPKTKNAELDIKSINGDSIVFSLPAVPKTAKRKFVEIELLNSGYNKLLLTDLRGEEFGFVNTSGKGRYRIDISDLSGIPDNLILFASRKESEAVIYVNSFDNGCVKVGKRAVCSLADAPDGTPAFAVFGFESVKDHPSEELYVYPDNAFTVSDLVGIGEITKSDMGRTFDISFRIYDTVSRYIKLGLSHATSMEKSTIDVRRDVINILTKPGEWVDVSIKYEVYEYMYEDFDTAKKTLTLSLYGNGNLSTPVYISDIKSSERVTSVEFAKVYLIMEEEPKESLPDGKSEIACKKSPWQK